MPICSYNLNHVAIDAPGKAVAGQDEGFERNVRCCTDNEFRAVVWLSHQWPCHHDQRHAQPDDK